MITARDVISHATDFYKDERIVPIVFVIDREEDAFGFVFDGFRERRALMLLMTAFAQKYPNYLQNPENWTSKKLMIRVKKMGLPFMDKLKKELVDFIDPKYFDIEKL